MQLKKYRDLAVFVLVLFGMMGCAQPTIPAQHATPAQRVGGDRDAHGCIGSAGYLWCARENACVRPWELSAQKSLAQGAEAFQQYCNSH